MKFFGQIFACFLLVTGSHIRAAAINEETLNKTENIITRFVSGMEMDDILQKYPNALPIEPTSSKQAIPGKPTSRDPIVVQYTLGYRVSGDYLVATDMDTNSFYAPTDVQLQQNYPSQGTGAILTYVNIAVHQSNDIGRAYIVAGGIGQRFISIIVEASQTYWFDYQTSMYGR